MQQITVTFYPLAKEQIATTLEEHSIFINHYAEELIAHPQFLVDLVEKRMITIAPLQELGFENGATLDEIAVKISMFGLKPCPVSTGLFLRLEWKNQPQSQNSVLSGTHSAPDQAVTVFSEWFEEDDAFPKGLYLRVVDGRLWLRGYVCDRTYRFPGSAMFAFEACTDKKTE